jgi:hypoxanthine phosphoribosyltransferase
MRLEKRALAAEIPSSLFHENPPLFICLFLLKLFLKILSEMRQNCHILVSKLNFLWKASMNFLKMFKICHIFVLGCVYVHSNENTNLELLISSETIDHRLQEVAQDIEKEYLDKDLVLVPVMKGAMCITSDLMRYLHIPCTIECVKASSYGQHGTKRGLLTISGMDQLDLSSKHLLVIDDILDSGQTMKGIVEHLQQKNPKSIKTLVLLSKNVRRSSAFCPDYVLFDIADRFVVGYGLDYKEYYRNLPGIYAFIGDNPPDM